MGTHCCRSARLPLFGGDAPGPRRTGSCVRVVRYGPFAGADGPGPAAGGPFLERWAPGWSWKTNVTSSKLTIA